MAPGMAYAINAVMFMRNNTSNRMAKNVVRFMRGSFDPLRAGEMNSPARLLGLD